ncbi:hypothetical protein RSOLAG1IB_00149 [Rhizoctonia solani AG-1 IB]|uniref:Uncharacterized protein n=1 Tax=Thanatephorus cucumeris (strain AG1-IB / isolate 7/3/14) TaxID=1108050 RepID=A0A0B7F3W8_THACB|nr:hypothetical protein RSOLAG1IB_00149 [Rhizoctonia solani AG-1 IB]
MQRDGHSFHTRPETDTCPPIKQISWAIHAPPSLSPIYVDTRESRKFAYGGDVISEEGPCIRPAKNFHNISNWNEYNIVHLIDM